MSNTKLSFHHTAIHAVNEALVTLGQDVILAELAIDSNIAEARKCAYLYEGSRKKVLRDHNWNFARRECETCACSAEQNQDEFGFNFSTPMPHQCIRLLACYGIPQPQKMHFRIFGNTVHSKSPIHRMVYIADIEDLDKWSPDAYRALVLRLAADLAKPITGRINERQLQESAYQEQLENAKLADAKETNTPDDVWGDNHTVKAMQGGINRCCDIHFWR